MPNYRRAYFEAGTYFFTVVTYKRNKILCTKDSRENLIVATSESRQKRGEQAIWQRRFWEHLIRDEKDFERHCDYIHYNPVKHGYVTAPKDWPFSTFHRFVKRGVYDEGWGARGEVKIDETMGNE